MQLDALDLRKNFLVNYQGRICTIVHWNIWKSDRRSRVQMRVKDLLTGRISEITAQGTDKYDVLDSENIDLEHSYREGDQEVFYTPAGEEYRCAAAGVEEQLKWKVERYRGLLIDGKLVTIALPMSVVATVAETSPVMKGSGQTGLKDAILDNGIQVKVGMIVGVGDKVRIDSDTYEYKERVT